jgi:hypothetical protein
MERHSWAALEHPVSPCGTPGNDERMIWLLLFMLAIIAFGIWGAIKLTFWVLLIALLVMLVAGFLGRGLFGRT